MVDLIYNPTKMLSWHNVWQSVLNWYSIHKGEPLSPEILLDLQRKLDTADRVVFVQTRDFKKDYEPKPKSINALLGCPTDAHKGVEPKTLSSKMLSLDSIPVLDGFDWNPTEEEWVEKD